MEWVVNLKTDKELIEEFSKGNIETTTNEFVRRYKNFIYLIAYRYVKNHDDAEDITQDVFIDAIRKLKDFRQESSLKTWLYRITVNKAKNHLRRKTLLTFISFARPDDENDLDFPDKSQSNNYESKELEEKFLEILSSLPEKQREVFSLRYFEDLSFNEISDMLGTSVGGLKANYFHAVRKIAKEMKKYLEE